MFEGVDTMTGTSEIGPLYGYSELKFFTTPSARSCNLSISVSAQECEEAGCAMGEAIAREVETARQENPNTFNHFSVTYHIGVNAEGQTLKAAFKVLPKVYLASKISRELDMKHIIHTDAGTTHAMSANRGLAQWTYDDAFSEKIRDKIFPCLIRKECVAHFYAKGERVPNPVSMSGQGRAQSIIEKDLEMAVTEILKNQPREVDGCILSENWSASVGDSNTVVLASKPFRGIWRAHRVWGAQKNMYECPEGTAAILESASGMRFPVSVDTVYYQWSVPGMTMGQSCIISAGTTGGENDRGIPILKRPYVEFIAGRKYSIGASTP